MIFYIFYLYYTLSTIFVIQKLKLKAMTRITINKTNPVFVAGVKSEMAAKKQRFSKYFSIIIGTKSNTIIKLKQMNVG